MSPLLDDLRWYRRVFVPSLRLIWRHRPRHIPEPRAAPSLDDERAARAAGIRAARGDGGDVADPAPLVLRS